MATKKKTTPAKKSSAKKATSKKPAPKKTATKKPGPRKAAENPNATIENKAAASALKLVDDAAKLLRDTIRSSASSTHKARLQAKSRARTMLGKAHSTLESLINKVP